MHTFLWDSFHVSSSRGIARCGGLLDTLPQSVQLVLALEVFLLGGDHAWRENTLTHILGVVLDSLKRIFRILSHLSWT